MKAYTLLAATCNYSICMYGFLFYFINYKRIGILTNYLHHTNLLEGTCTITENTAFHKIEKQLRLHIQKIIIIQHHLFYITSINTHTYMVVCRAAKKARVSHHE